MAGRMPSLQNGIDQAGLPVRILWAPGPGSPRPEKITPEYAGWRRGPGAWD